VVWLGAKKNAQKKKKKKEEFNELN